MVQLKATKLKVSTGSSAAFLFSAFFPRGSLSLVLWSSSARTHLGKFSGLSEVTVLAAIVVLIVCSAGLVRHSSSSDTQGLEDSSDRFSCSIVQFDAVHCYVLQ